MTHLCYVCGLVHEGKTAKHCINALRLRVRDLEHQPNFFEDIRQFHHKFKLAYDGKPRILPKEIVEFRFDFMREELKEYADSYGPTLNYGIPQQPMLPGFSIDPVAVTLEDMLDALVDLTYVALGTAYLHGFNFNEAWHRVHKANMKKVRAERPEQSTRGSTYDVIKPPGWQAPSHRDLVEDHAHRSER